MRECLVALVLPALPEPPMVASLATEGEKVREVYHKAFLKGDSFKDLDLKWTACPWPQHCKSTLSAVVHFVLA